MEATALSIGKSVLNRAIWYAKSTIVEEVALQYGVHRNKAFITDELEMMQSFLMVAHDERDEHNKVVRTWVKQVRDVAYDVEDGLQDFVLRVHGKSWWRIPRTFLDRRHVANQMKELRDKVKDVSQRNVRYHLINCASKASDLSITTPAAMFGIDEAGMHAMNQHESGSRLDLTHLIVDNKKGLGSDQTGVIGVWGTSGTVRHTSIIWEAYENTNVKLNFPCQAWVRVTQPFNRKEFVESIVEQFRGTSAGVVEFLLEPEANKTTHELAHEYNGYVSKNRYLIVLTELSTIEEWHRIKTCFPENKLGSRIIVSTEHVEVASLCPGQESIASGLKQLSAEQTIYAFYQQLPPRPSLQRPEPRPSVQHSEPRPSHAGSSSWQQSSPSQPRSSSWQQTPPSQPGSSSWQQTHPSYPGGYFYQQPHPSEPGGSSWFNQMDLVGSQSQPFMTSVQSPMFTGAGSFFAGDGDDDDRAANTYDFSETVLATPPPPYTQETQTQIDEAAYGRGHRETRPPRQRLSPSGPRPRKPKIRRRPQQ